VLAADAPHLPPHVPRLLPAQVKEPLLVRDVLYAAQGIPGKFTVWQESGATNPAGGAGM
jgi:hypothetical protein